MLAGILVVSGVPLTTIGAAVGIASSAGLAAIMQRAYSRERFFAFLHPWHDAAGTGYQILQAMIGMGSGHIFGVGLGRGVQKIFYLPEAHTDMMLANIGEELGLVGVTAVIGAYALFAYAGFNIALRCKDPFGKRLATGLTVLVCGQAAINIFAVMGTAPLTGIPLPFLSYGGSSLVVLLAAVGILLNIGHRGNAAAASVPDRSRRDGRSRAAGDRSGGRAQGPRRSRDVRRVAGSRRSASGS
jgi:cell division protein FtsW